MHELALAHQVVEIVLKEAQKHNMRRVEIIRLRLGILRAVVEEMLRTGIDVTTQDTIAHGAKLEIELVSGRAVCPACHEQYAIADLLFSCPRCGQISGQIVAGQEFQVVDFEGD